MNRTLKFSAIALFAVAVLWACGGGSAAKSAGESFLMAMAKGDIEGAKKFATKEAQGSLDMMKASAEEKKAKPDKIELGEIKENGDKATLSYKENGTDKTLELVKEDGQWKAAWSKNPLGGMEDLGKGLEEAAEEIAPAAEEGAETEGTEGTEEGTHE